MADQPLRGKPAARVLVAGASGFAGALAAEIVWGHPRLELREATSRSDAGLRVADLYPRYRADVTMTDLDVDAVEECEAAIVAYPHHASAPVVAALRELGLLVIDLSADFRLRDPYVYREWYGELAAPELLGDAVYGLPELYRERIREAGLVANPGCYTTCAQLPPIPPFTANASVDDLADRARLDQGELVSCYVRPSRPVEAAAVRELYADRYREEPFVEVIDRPPGVREVRDTNLCRIHVDRDAGGRILVFAAIDNLWKGAAGQAIQNLNLMLGLDEEEGLT